jgi:hypothetical protein
MSAVVVLGDELEIDRAHGAATVLHLEAHVGKDEPVAIDVKALGVRDGQPGVPVWLSFRPLVAKRSVRGTL